MLLSVTLTVIGVVMLAFPRWMWHLSERWKSNDATEPSALYLFSVRFGGAACLLVGIASAAVRFL